MRLVERDYEILREIERWRCCLGRHVRYLASFTGQRACDRRLKILLDNGYLERKRILYGVPSLYNLTAKAKKLMGYSLRKDKIKIEQITHDIAVLDTVIYFLYKEKIPLSDMQSEKELHSQEGFGVRTHKPDFVFTKNSKTYAVEIELNLKAKARLEKNIKSNFLAYEEQKWIVPKAKVKIKTLLDNYSTTYPNITIIQLEEVTNYVRNLLPNR
ncbi:hypothetical protein [Anaerostipes sp.]|uniref:hypothetical protein n=1 Tax=Anaerostipes sp. TaxID=1872530 RepID=UPI0025C04DF7|nr:hypothetical protein [Anaerostipes sp.]MBS7008294.1 replication-relaxation family protein [Anaerostipes sp.]